MSNLEIIPIQLGDRSYGIHLGHNLLRDHADELLAAVIPAKRVIIVTDENVATQWLDQLERALDGASISHWAIILPAGEETKNFHHLEQLMHQILEAKPDRRTPLIALGGGVIGDITGFAASILLRGVPFIQIPTTLLAQVDSSVGGKTGINTPHGKNLVGSFYQPKMVLIDPATLATLPRRQFLAGYAEVVKYAALGDAPFFDWLENHSQAIANLEPAAIHEMIARCCRAKAAIVQSDEREAGARALLNLGHTFGHALEAETGFSDRLLHGEAVAIGMVMAADFSAGRSLCPASDAERLKNHLQEAGLPVHPQDIQLQWDALRLRQSMQQDKKSMDGRLTFILLQAMGNAFISHDVTAAELDQYLLDTLAA